MRQVKPLPAQVLGAWQSRSSLGYVAHTQLHQRAYTGPKDREKFSVGCSLTVFSSVQ